MTQISRKGVGTTSNYPLLGTRVAYEQIKSLHWKSIVLLWGLAWFRQVFLTFLLDLIWYRIFERAKRRGITGEAVVTGSSSEGRCQCDVVQVEHFTVVPLAANKN